LRQHGIQQPWADLLCRVLHGGKAAAKQQLPVTAIAVTGVVGAFNTRFSRDA
jgi:hypothetical protein